MISREENSIDNDQSSSTSHLSALLSILLIFSHHHLLHCLPSSPVHCALHRDREDIVGGGAGGISFQDTQDGGFHEGYWR